VAERKKNASLANTRVAALRVRLGVTQQELASASGVGLRAIQDLERGFRENPHLRHLTNIALALGVKLEDVCEPEWLVWTTFPNKPEKPVVLAPRPDRFVLPDETAS
jgi:transcriptional regulator with XRE-family HTH domain